MVGVVGNGRDGLALWPWVPARAWRYRQHAPAIGPVRATVGGAVLTAAYWLLRRVI